MKCVHTKALNVLVICHFRRRPTFRAQPVCVRVYVPYILFTSLQIRKQTRKEAGESIIIISQHSTCLSRQVDKELNMESFAGKE